MYLWKYNEKVRDISMAVKIGISDTVELWVPQKYEARLRLLFYCKKICSWTDAGIEA